MPWTEPLTRKPGEFRANCRLATVVKTHLATPAQKDEAQALGLQRHHLGQDARGKDVWAWHFPACDGFETTDREAYQAHLEEFHGGGHRLEVPWSGKLRGPLRPSTNGRPLTKAAAEQLRKCPTCGLHAQVDGTAGELWWAEHERGCSIAEAAS